MIALVALLEAKHMSPFRLPKSPVYLAWAEPLAKPPSPVSGTLTESRCDSRPARVLS